MHPLSAPVKACPYAYYDAWREKQPVCWNPAMDAWLVLGYDEASTVLSRDDVFSSTNSIFSPGAGDVDAFPSVINADGERQARLRAIAAAAFSPSAVRRTWAPVIRATVDDLLGRVTGGTLYAVRDLASPLPLRVLATILGFDDSRHEWLRWVAAEAARGMGAPPQDDGEIGTGFFAAVAEFRIYIASEAAERRRQPTDDLLTRLVHDARTGEKMSDAELEAFLFLLLAMSEADTNTIGGAIRALADDAPLLQRVRGDRSLVWNLIEETLRHDSPVQALYRRAMRDVDIGGTQIKAGDALCVLYGAANRDPAYAELPAQFNLDAARQDHLAFGAGAHACAAAALARVEAEITLNGVLDRFETLEPLLRADEVRWRSTPFFRGMAEYPLRYTLDVKKARPAPASVYLAP